jgi:hypothetical protein
MFGGIREILIVSMPQDQPLFERLLCGGSELGIAIFLRHTGQIARTGRRIHCRSRIRRRRSGCAYPWGQYLLWTRIAGEVRQQVRKGNSLAMLSIRQTDMASLNLINITERFRSKNIRASRSQMLRSPGYISATTMSSTSPHRSSHQLGAKLKLPTSTAYI